MKSVLCVGGCVIDILLIKEDISLIDSDFKKFFGLEYGSKIFANEFIINEGGSATNVALNLKSLGIDSGILAIIGNDFLGDFIFQRIVSSGVNIKGIRRSKKEKTGISLIVRSPEFEDRSMITYKGANDLLSISDIDEDFVKNFDYLVWCSLTSINALESIDKLITMFRDRKKMVIAAPSSSVIKKFPELTLNLVKKSSVFAANLEESKYMLKNEDLGWGECANRFLEFGLKFVSITNGKDGVILGEKNELIKLTPPSINIVETSGVGDAFLAGLIYGLINHKNYEESGKLGTGMACSVLQGFGTRGGVPNLDELNKLVMYLGSKIKVTRVE